MRRLSSFGLLLLSVSFLVMTGAQAQVGRAVATYNEQDAGDMYMIRQMADPKVIAKCKRSDVVGTIAYVNVMTYDSRPEITHFVLRTSKGQQQEIYLPEVLYPKRLSGDDAKLLSSLISKGRKVRVGTYRCGASTSTLYADQITGLN